MRWVAALRRLAAGGKPLGLRGKTVLILVATIILASLSVVVGSRIFYQRGIEEIERADAEAAVKRAAALVEDDLEQLDIIAVDWAFWDDTWNFAAGGNAVYAESNLGDESLLAIKISSMLILNARGETVFARQLEGRELGVLETALRKAGVPGDAGRRGIIRAGDELHLYAARPIKRSDTSGPVTGILAVTRLVNETRAERYSRLSGLPSRILPLTPDQAAEGVSISLDSASIQASMALPEEAGPPAAKISVSVPRATDRYSGRSFALFLVSVTFVVALLGMLSVLAFEVAVLGRMRLIGTELEAIAQDAGAGKHLTESGSDELAVLERRMNATLDSLYLTIRERNAAMREIHHRVKNNLQVVASLVNLQAGAAREEETVNALRDIGQRVLAMAFVHEELNIDREIERVDAGHLVERIASSIKQNAGSGRNVELSIECGSIGIGLERAVPIGLVVGEVLTNAYRHAFPPGRDGTIRVSIASDPEGGISISVRDDGVGLGPARRRGLGMDLIHALAQQLLARYGYGPDPRGGTLFTLEVPPDSGSKPPD